MSSSNEHDGDKPPIDKGAADRTVFRAAAGAREGAAPDMTRIRPQSLSDKIDPTRLLDPQRTRIKEQEIHEPLVPKPGAGFGHQSAEELRVLKGRFILEKVLGVGGMGVVYKAKDRLKVEAQDRDPYVAIKVLSDEFKSHPESFIALQRESRKGQKIAHPNVVKVYDFDRDGDIVFMTMEFLEGRPLDQFIRQYSSTGLPRDDVWTILDGICSALIQAHSEKIVHSDFKPGNIFVTNSGVAKIFDFGIARAVASVDRQASGGQDKTVFDAGTLGALTPAYASLEMLAGKAPDLRDDIYALGCITYEMLTGMHPYNRLPADEAYKRKLKPRRISGIKNIQWKAIEKALALKSEDRIASVEEFYKQVLGKRKSSIVRISSILIILSLLVTVVMLLNNEEPAPPLPPPPVASVNTDELEFKIRYDIFKQKIETLLAEPSFTSSWEKNLADEFKNLSALLGDKMDAWLESTTRAVYEMYLSKISALIERKEYGRAKELIINAYQYHADRAQLDAELARIEELVRIAAQDEARMRKTQEVKLRTEEVKLRTEQVKAADVQHRQTLYDQAMANVNKQLECRSSLSMSDFRVAIEKLREVDMPGYQKAEGVIVAALAQCISQIGKSSPESAQEYKQYALRIFGDKSIINEIKISARDACDQSLAGMGGRGDHSICRDRLQGAGSGPALVVIPGNTVIPAFAIGKYEISNAEWNQFCAATGECRSVKEDNLPVTNVRLITVMAYVKWLSRSTGQKYRLPTRAEWTYAANSTNRSHDPNRNCAVNSRGIEKGNELIKINTGIANSWGVVNYLGNAREMVHDEGLNLLAIGGSFDDNMQECSVDNAKSYSGAGDEITGFRVVRELAHK